MPTSATLEPVSPPVVVPRADQERLLIHGVDWRAYVLLRELLDSPGLRMTYLDGALELMTPSRRHEHVKTTIARLIEVFALERDVPLHGYGSTTFRREIGRRGLEPDECWTLGREMSDEGPPDIALEVIVTSPLLDKLVVYAGLGIRELWVWEDGTFRFFALREAARKGEESTYEEIGQSELVPALDFTLLAPFTETGDQHGAVRAYRDHLRSVAET